MKVTVNMFNKIRSLILVCLLINCSYSKSQDKEVSFLGEWFENTDYESPSVIIFRSNYTYLVYNDLDYHQSDEKTSHHVFFDDGIRTTALVEMGRWQYDKITQNIMLFSRDFIKHSSEFNRYHSKEKELIFKIKEISATNLSLCSVINKQKCDNYIKNANPLNRKNITFYKEIDDNYSGGGNHNKELFLSGYETELKISYDFYKEADQLTITDKSGKKLFSTDMVATNGRRTKEIDLCGVTQLVFKVESSNPSSKWKIKVQIK